MSTPANPLQPGPWGVPGVAPQAQPPTQSQPQSPAGAGGGFFSRIGQTLKQVMPYITPIANRLAAAAGNYGPIELEHQQREDALKQSTAQTQQALAQSQMENQTLNRQLLQKNIDNYQTPQQASDLRVKEAGALEAARAANAPGTVTSAPLPEGGYGQFRVKGTNAEPIMQHQQVPNPALAPYNTQAPPTNTTDASRADFLQSQFAPKPNMVQDWNAGAPPTMPKTIDQTSQLMAIQKGMTRGQPIRQPDGSYAIPVFNPQQQVDHYTTLEGTPLPQVPKTEFSSTNSLQKDANGNIVSIPKNTSKTTGPTPPLAPPNGGANPAAAPMTKPPTPGGPKATPVIGPDGQPLHGPLGAASKKTIGQINTSEGMVASLMPELNARVADLKSKGQDANSLWDMGMQRAAWAEYQAGKSPTNIDPTLAKILPVAAQLQIIAAQPFMNGSRNFQFMQQIQQHIPNPEKDTPALMVDKIHAMSKSFPIMRKAIMDAEGISQPAAPAATGGKWDPVAGVYK